MQKLYKIVTGFLWLFSSPLFADAAHAVKAEGWIGSVTQALATSTDVTSPYWYICVLAFLAGILVSLTPCIYPIIPITVGVITAQGPASMRHHFLLACSYVLGLSLVYAFLGYGVATTGAIFGHWITNEFVIGTVVIVFLYLAFSMFGFYEIGLPAWLVTPKRIPESGSFLSTFMFGAASGFVVSPCLAAPLALLLTYVTKLGSPYLGFLILFCFALGMSLLLIVIGTFAGAVRYLPYAGEWMIFVERFFGFVLLFMCALFLEPLVNTLTMYLMYSAISFFVALYYLLGMREAWKQRCKCDQPIAGQEEIHNRRRIGKIVVLEVMLAIFFIFVSLFYAVRAYANYRNVPEYTLIYKLATTPPYRWSKMNIWKRFK